MINKRLRNILKSSTKRATLVLLLFFVALTVIPTGETSASSQSELDKLNEQIDAATKKLNTKKGESRTLANQVAIFDDQIYKLQLEIDATQREMDIVNSDIIKTNQKIKDNEMDLKAQKATLFEYLRVIYEEGETSTLELIVVSNNFSDFVDKAEYLQVMQMKVNETVEKIKALKLELDKKKADLVTKRVKLEGLRKQQVTRKEAVNSQRAAKDSLLATTRGQESAYRALTKKLQAEYNRIQQEMWAAVNSGSYVSQGPISKGDIVGTMGNTGYSSGDHLHFEFWNAGGTKLDPAGIVGHGNYGMPVTNYTITQGCYGTFSHAGAGGPCAIDYVTFNSPPSVRAVASGEIILRVTGQGNTFPGGPMTYGNHVVIKHNDGTYSLYAHLR